APGGRPHSGRKPSARATKPKSPPPAEAAPAKRAPSKIAAGAAGLEASVEQAGTGLRGPALARLAELGTRTVKDALLHIPFRHIDFSPAVPISAVRPGDEAAVRGVVERSRIVPMGRHMKAAEVTISDGLGRISALFFNQVFQVKNFPV